MLLFHEGLPGSGKSYESVVHHIFPALKSGRKVFAFVEGLNHEKIASVLNLELSVVESLLIQIDREQVEHIYDVVEDNSFVVIDELQNFFPSGKQKLEPKITQFVTEHRHRGIDILAMGQDYRDCHSLWKRRIDQKVNFLKLDMLGKSNSYKWTVSKSIAGEKFKQVASGVTKYDERYFGTYKSHTSADTRTEQYNDSRAVIWNNRLFQFGAVFVLAALLFSPIYLKKFFSSDSPLLQNSVLAHAPVSAPSVVAPSPQSAVYYPPGASPATPPVVSQQLDYVGKLASQYRVRLFAALISPGRPAYAVVEFRDSSLRVQERLDSATLMQLGWRVEVLSLTLVRLHRNGQSEMYATPWPIIDPAGQLSDVQNQRVRNASGGDSARARARVRDSDVESESDRQPQDQEAAPPYPPDGGIPSGAVITARR